MKHKSKGSKARCPGKLEVGFAELGSSHEEVIPSVARPETLRLLGINTKKGRFA